MSLQRGEQNLDTLLASMEPILDEETYAFLTTTQPLHTLPLESLQPQMLFQESEGVSIITSQVNAILHGFQDYVFPCKKISLTVHSSLEAVGLNATITSRLGMEGISTNVVSGYYHDHIFVPLGKEEAAMLSLKQLMVEAEHGLSKGLVA